MDPLDQNEATVESVRAGLLARLPRGYPALADLARELGLSARTLQRRLAAAGQSYSGLVEATRLEVALTLLRQESMPIAKIATSLGYEDAAHFTRAFRRWTGKAPTEMRRELTGRSRRGQARRG